MRVIGSKKFTNLLEKQLAYYGLVAFLLFGMLEEVYKILDKAIKLNEGKAFVFAVDSRVKKLIINLNTRNQLGEFGIDALGDSLGEYAPFTVQKRTELGLQTGHIDFKVTGDYWASWTVTVNREAITIVTDPQLFSELVNDLGFAPEHVGLTPDNLNKLTAVMLTRYQIYLNKQIGL